MITLTAMLPLFKRLRLAPSSITTTFAMKIERPLGF
jgi:Mg2+/citrate symporter